MRGIDRPAELKSCAESHPELSPVRRVAVCLCHIDAIDSVTTIQRLIQSAASKGPMQRAAFNECTARFPETLIRS